MTFSMRPLGFVEDIATRIAQSRYELLGKLPPKSLFHYTSVDGVLGITKSRSIRATCVADLEDGSEIRHGAKLIEQEVQRIVRDETSAFTKELLIILPQAVLTRADHTFVVCFCGTRGSLFHWYRYGNYCVEIATDQNREPQLRLSVNAAYLRYYKVIYGEGEQRKHIRLALQAVVEALQRRSAGTLDGPWLKHWSSFLARNVAELLLDLVICFKKRKFWLDREWRLVARPSPELCSSAPEMADRNFDAFVKKDKTRYVELTVPAERLSFTPKFQPHVPFSSVTQSPFVYRPAELHRIRVALCENGRNDIPVQCRLSSRSQAPSANLSKSTSGNLNHGVEEWADTSVERLL